MERTTASPTSIYSLPDEIIIMILKHTSYYDCNSFRRTCKRYNDLLKYSHSLWRVMYHRIAGKVIYNITSTQSTGDWLCDLRQYLSLRESLIDLIVGMSEKHFCEYNKEISLEDVKEVFAIALSNNTNFYCTVTILQDHIQNAIKKLNTFETKKPYTLTEIHYAKMVVRYLIHILFTLKWVNLSVTYNLTPEIVLNFITQWLDPIHMHRDDEVQDLIKDMVKDVDAILLESSDSGRLPGVETHNACESGVYSERQVLMAISHYMYKRRRMVLMTSCNEDSIDIVKTIKSNSGHGACLGAIFEAIARGFGITSCYLFAFPSHLYLEWRANRGFRNEMAMQFSLDTGELRSGGRCPFSANVHPNNPYNMKLSSPESLVQYILTNILRHTNYTGWYTDNAVHLMEFITSNRNSGYASFISYMSELEVTKLSKPFNIENIHEDHISIIHGLLHLNQATTPRYKELVVKRRTSAVKFCVGMLCFHKVFEYVCIIRCWDEVGAAEARARPEAAALELGFNQPFYHVTAVDLSDRYAAQENLILVTHPSRIYHLEDVIAKEFTHFNGFFYEPNDQMRALYPGDMAIGQMYAAKSLANVIPEKVLRY